MNNLAINGGPKTKETAFGSGKRWGEPELIQLAEAIEQNSMFYFFGTKVKTFLAKFGEMYNTKYVVSTSSGTASIHVALLAAGVTAGDEVITSPITDMGSVVGILYQNAIPVFADLDPHTYNMTAETIKAKISDKTKAIVLVHLAGNPCEMDEIVALCKEKNIKLIEDCAQSYNCYYKGKLAGTFGDYGCFSTNDFKHISTGDGGMILVNSGDEEDFKKTAACADKNYNRYAKTPEESRLIPFIAPNYRMTELQGAFGIAQLDRLNGICDRRSELGDRLTAGISGLKGVSVHQVNPGNKSSYWFYMLRVNEAELTVTRDKFAEALNAEGIPCSAGYIPMLVSEYALFENKNAYIGTKSPWNVPEYGKEITYRGSDTPIADAILKSAVRLSISEFYTDQDVDDMIAAIRKVALAYAK